MATVPGSEVITSILNMISQSLQIPVVIFLVIFAVFAVLTLGGLVSEYTSRKKIPIDSLEKIIYSISNAGSAEELKNLIKNAKIYESQKVVLIKVLRSKSLTKESRQTLARKLIEFEENKLGKKIERTDIVTKIGPTLGLMGTLIPMGPGLAALGAGDVNTLANAIIVAFDTTVVGIGSGAVAYFVSKIRRRWYEEYLSDLDSLTDALLDKLNQGEI
ncbi:MAG: MotA/TolQ/ExbB proton channel family protein [Methanobrevibacter sp.]|uniref:MotA/TolQ/ExbB proton channel family protein n=1 Tax=uncultured Methanobrevibacter sp. TaxID=253161 RepID=UPI0025D9031D|nr:MotA/TolQ/ExbB proton channel family protein [uncultured Methanobrevibacter sp.]MEE1129363.1 MotA/TolQ/ExbB proton channel family protein [Methanobrevibacter sp.]